MKELTQKTYFQRLKLRQPNRQNRKQQARKHSIDSGVTVYTLGYRNGVKRECVRPTTM